MATKTDTKLLVALQLIGSPTSQFFYNLSVLYGKQVVTPLGFELLFVMAYPDGNWSVGSSVEKQSQKMSLEELIPKVKHADLAVPHMFCQTGLTAIRSLFEDILQIPMVGSTAATLQLAQDKHLTKLIAKDVEVSVPESLLLEFPDLDTLRNNDLEFPLIVKPNHSDNSDGLSLVYSEDQFKQSCINAFNYDSEILIETYIPGRELRGAIIEIDDGFMSLPFIEYQVSVKQPIRNPEDKLKFDDENNLVSQSDKLNIPAVCPAILDQHLLEELTNMMITMHKALKCRDFSMYDFRIHAETGKPYLLETGLFWSFSKNSMISNMLSVDKINLLEITGDIWRQAVSRNA
ncbi:MAG: hypothetical protein WA775_01920 [Psychroserpens sp.]|uniref:D-alanine--D-alanine ligase family protein n=1 Tax=Psychroserpens sp. TaxID=2020870 RepID=UPI003C89CFE7